MNDQSLNNQLNYCEHIRFERKNLYTYVDVERLAGSHDRFIVAATDPIENTPSQFDVVHAWVIDWIIREKLTNAKAKSSRIYLIDDSNNRCEAPICPASFTSRLSLFSDSRRTTERSWPLPSSLVALIVIGCTAPNFPRDPNIHHQILS